MAVLEKTGWACDKSKLEKPRNFGYISKYLKDTREISPSVKKHLRDPENLTSYLKIVNWRRKEIKLDPLKLSQNYQKFRRRQKKSKMMLFLAALEKLTGVRKISPATRKYGLDRKEFWHR